MKTYQITSHYQEKSFYQELGRIVAQSGLAETFDIDETQPIETLNRNIHKMIGFYAYHCHEDVIGNYDQKYLSQIDII